MPSTTGSNMNTDRPIPVILLSVVAGLLPLGSRAYEVTTHAGITSAAVTRSRLASDASLLQQLDLYDRDVSNVFNSQYYDVSAKSEKFRTADNQNTPPSPYEANIMASFGKPLSLPGWVMRGAIREDDTPTRPGARNNNPQDNPFPPERYRPLHHFFDPYHNKALDNPGCVLEGACKRSPDWALGVTDAFATPVAADSSRLNHFTVQDAHEALWRAVTGTRFSDGGSVNQGGGRATEADRLAYWATVFRSLGDVIHHIQDMAQPQHTRNDAHSGVLCDASSTTCAFGHESYYELYIDARAQGASTFSVGKLEDGVQGKQLPKLDYVGAGIPIPTFARYSDYWSTGLSQASLTGKGMADYSSRGFFSAGTNIGSTTAALFPQPDPSKLTECTMPACPNSDPTQPVQSLSGTVLAQPLRIEAGAVQDYVSGFIVSDTGVKLATAGAFDQFLVATRNAPAYSLNYYNYDDQARLLLPRASAYSAGLINFFFRGNLRLSLPDEGIYSIVDHSQFGPPPGTPTDRNLGFKGFSKIRLKLANATAPITPPGGSQVTQDMSGGTLVAVLKFHRNTCYQDDLGGELTDPSGYSSCRSTIEEVVASHPVTVQSGDIPFSSQANPNGTEFEFTFDQGNQLPINAWSVRLQVIYRGKLGSEDDAVVVATKDISEPTFISIYDDTDYILINGKCDLGSTLGPSSPEWASLTQSCKNGNVASAACYGLPMNIQYTFGSGQHQVVVAMVQNGGGDGRLRPGRLGRFAVLAELGQPLMASQLLFGSSQTDQFPVYVADQHVQINASGDRTLESTADFFTQTRNIKTYDGLAMIVDGTTAAITAAPVGQNTSGLGCNDSGMPLLTPYPQPLTITGW